MKIISDIPEKDSFFTVVATTPNCQVATMTLQPGQPSGEYGNEHPRSDQVLYVISGEGHAEVEGRRIELQPGLCLVIAAGENHRVVGGREQLRTLNFYAPVAYPEEND